MEGQRSLYFGMKVHGDRNLSKSIRCIGTTRCLHQFCIIDLEGSVMHTYTSTDPEGDNIPRGCCRTLAPLFIIEMFDLRRNASSDFDPEIQLIANSKITGKFQRHHFRTGIIIDDTADQEPPIVRTAVTHHLLSLVSFHVCCCEVPIKHLRQMIAIIIVDRWIFFS